MNDKRIHGVNACGAGHAGNVADGEILGPCPSCAAELRVARVEDPRTGRLESALLHPLPFCTYYGKTDPITIERDVARAKGN